MKKIILIIFLFASIQAFTQKIEVIKIDSLHYNFTVSGVNNIVKYEWCIAAPPKYAEQTIITKKDTLNFNFTSSGTVSIFVKYKCKNEDWSDGLFKSYNIK